MKKILIIAAALLCGIGPAAFPQENPAPPLQHQKKVFIAEKEKDIYWPMSMPFWVKLAASPEENAPSYLLSKVHPKYRTPHIVTMITGCVVAIAAAFFPVGQLADISNAGTLYAFLMVAVAVMVLRKTDGGRARSFRVPAVWIIAPLTMAGCLFLFLNLPTAAMLFLPAWTLLGLFVYFLYSRSRSHLGRGIVEVVDDVAGEETMVPIHPPKDA